MKNKLWKRLIAFTLLSTVMFTTIPVTTINATEMREEEFNKSDLMEVGQETVAENVEKKAEQSQKFPYETENLMPSTGEVKALVFMVNFPDLLSLEMVSPEEREEQLFDLSDVNSFSGFYYASSYGKLEIDGDIYGYYTAEHEHEYYDNALGAWDLLRELLEYYDDEIDYADYDADKDGIIDSLHIEFVTESADGNWHTHMSSVTKEDFIYDGISACGYTWIHQEYVPIQAYIHETGHLLGLPDYYDTANNSAERSLGTFDMMVGNDGDHNAFSKMLLGWIEPITISEDTTIELRSSQLYPDAAIVYPNNDESSDEYFLIEYITGDGANNSYAYNLGEGGLRVWRINATLNEQGTFFKYWNVSDWIKLIEAVGICNVSMQGNSDGNQRKFDRGSYTRPNIYFEGDELTPYSNPSSYIYGDIEENNCYGPFTTSGVVIDNILINDGVAKVNVSYDHEKRTDFEYRVQYLFESLLMVEMTFDYETTLLDAEKITVSNGVEEIEVDAELVFTPDYGFKKLFIFSKETDLEISGEYTLQIEEGAMINVYGVHNPTITVQLEANPIATGLINSYNTDDGTYTKYTDIISIADEGFIFYIDNSAIWMSRIYLDSDGELLTEETCLMELKYEDPYISAVKNGNTIGLGLCDASGVFYLYEVSQNGEIEELYHQNYGWWRPSIYVVGNNYYVYDGSSTLRTVAPLTKEVKDYAVREASINSIWDIGNGNALVYYINEFYIMDSECNFTKQIDWLSDTEIIVDVLVKEELSLVLTSDVNGSDADLSAIYLDKEYNVINKKKILNDSYFGASYSKRTLNEYGDGYVIRMEQESPGLMRNSQYLYMEDEYSITEMMSVLILDEELNYVSEKVILGCPMFNSYGGEYFYVGVVGEKIVYSDLQDEKLHLYSIDEYEAQSTSDNRIDELELDRDKVVLSVGGSYRLRDIYEPYYVCTELIWTSENENIATVDRNGKVIAMKPGTVTITATDGNGMIATCVITVAETSEDNPDNPDDSDDNPVDDPVDNPVDNPFTDVAEGQYYYKPVLWAVENNITAGLSATEFGPGESCTRAQIVTFLWRAAGRPEATTGTNPFTDVPSDAYYTKAVLWAVENNITAGLSATEFGPEETCTRAQIVTFLWRAFGRQEPTTTTNPFTDVSSNAYYAKAVLWAVENNITAGLSATEFGPDSPCTRGQVVSFLYRAYAK